jgi:hypothetical protein
LSTITTTTIDPTITRDPDTSPIITSTAVEISPVTKGPGAGSTRQNTVVGWRIATLCQNTIGKVW